MKLQKTHSLEPTQLTGQNFSFSLFSATETTTNGYVKPILKTTVPDDTNRMLSNPNTPQHSSWQSPDHTRDTSSVQRYVFHTFSFISFSFTLALSFNHKPNQKETKFRDFIVLNLNLVRQINITGLRFYLNRFRFLSKKKTKKKCKKLCIVH